MVFSSHLLSVEQMWNPLGNVSYANQTARWQPEPLTRGTFSILSSCLVTLGLCAWSTLHLNIPERGKANTQFWRKTRWLLGTILAPEVVSYVPASSSSPFSPSSGCSEPLTRLCHQGCLGII